MQKSAIFCDEFKETREKSASGAARYEPLKRKEAASVKRESRWKHLTPLQTTATLIFAASVGG